MSTFDLPSYMAAKTTALAALRERLGAPDAGPTPLTVSARVAGGSGARPIRVRDFTIVTDALPALAGNNLGPTAPELLLSALASCVAHSYLVVALKHGLVFRGLEVDVTGEIDYRGTLEVDSSAPIPPGNIRYVARIDSDADAATLERVRQDVERTCPVFQALRRPIDVAGQVVSTAGA